MVTLPMDDFLLVYKYITNFLTLILCFTHLSLIIYLYILWDFHYRQSCHLQTMKAKFLYFKFPSLLFHMCSSPLSWAHRWTQVPTYTCNVLHYRRGNLTLYLEPKILYSSVSIPALYSGADTISVKCCR